MEKIDKKRNSLRRWLGIAALALVCALISGGVTFAWLTNQRTIAAVAAVDTPRSLWITAGHAEDAMFLDLSNIDVTIRPSDYATKGYYKDFVFAVKGAYISQYKIQLAYTTNNQFSYELYHATDVTPQSGAPESYNVEYYSKQYTRNYYYSIDTTYTAELTRGIAKTKLNPTGGSQDAKTAKTSDGYSKETYEGLATSGQYANIDTYAMPIYEQTDSSINSQPGSDNTFVNYYILRVKWDMRVNDRETDMIYISAKAT